METVSSITMPEIIAIERPVDAEFAIIDLALDQEMLGWVYEQMQHRDIRWESLYQGTDWQQNWKSGPILIELKGSDSCTDALAKLFPQYPNGLFINVPGVTPETLAEQLRQHAIIELNGKQAAFRFYDPRHLTELLSILTDIQRNSLVRPGEQWVWHDSDQWQSYSCRQSGDALAPATSIVLSQEQLESFETLKRLKKARSLASHYQEWVKSSDPEKVIFDHLTAAKKAGLDKVSDQERWLRIALTLSSPVQNSSAWQALATNDQLTPRQRLSNMEKTV